MIIVDLLSGTYFAMEDARAVELYGDDEELFAAMSDEDRIDYARSFGWEVSARAMDES